MIGEEYWAKFSCTVVWTDTCPSPEAFLPTSLPVSPVATVSVVLGHPAGMYRQLPGPSTTSIT